MWLSGVKLALTGHWSIAEPVEKHRLKLSSTNQIGIEGKEEIKESLPRLERGRIKNSTVTTNNNPQNLSPKNNESVNDCVKEIMGMLQLINRPDRRVDASDCYMIKFAFHQLKCLLKRVEARLEKQFRSDAESFWQSVYAPGLKPL